MVGIGIRQPMSVLAAVGVVWRRAIEAFGRVEGSSTRRFPWGCAPGWYMSGLWPWMDGLVRGGGGVGPRRSGTAVAREDMDRVLGFDVFAA